MRLNDEEVDELLDIICQALERGLGDGKVLSGAELGGQTPSDSQLSSNLRGSRKTECHVGSLEDVSNEIQISGGEDEGNSDSEGDSGCARVLPAKKAVEHAVIVCLLSGPL